MKYLDCRDWHEVARWAVAENILQSRTQNTAKRISSELIYRLKTLSDTELSRLAAAPLDERKVWLWIAICRAYSLVREFAVEVIRERFLAGNTRALSLVDFDAFYERKTAMEPSLASVSSSTLQKIRQKTFQLLIEAGLLSHDKSVSGVIISERLLREIPPEEHDLFPIFIKG